MSRCRDCRYWTPATPGWSAPTGFGDCANDKFVLGYHEYGTGDDGVDLDGAVIEDDEGWGWRTGPDFGCIHFAAREKGTS